MSAHDTPPRMPRDNCVVMLEAHLDRFPDDSALLARTLWPSVAPIAKRRRVTVSRSVFPSRDIPLDGVDNGDELEVSLPLDQVMKGLPDTPRGFRVWACSLVQARRFELGIISAMYDRLPFSPRIRLNLELNRSESLRRDVMTEFPKIFASIFEIIDATGLCSQGYIDSTWAWETGGNHIYQILSTSIDAYPFKRTMEQLDAHDMLLPGKRDRVFGSFWAHYLRPELAKKLDPDGSFKKRFLGVRPPTNEPLDGMQTVWRFPSGGMFLTISGTPADLTAEYAGTYVPWYAAALWLRQEFREKGLL